MKPSVISVKIKDRASNRYELSEMCNAELEICKSMTLEIEFNFPIVDVAYRNNFVFKKLICYMSFVFKYLHGISPFSELNSN